VGFRFISEHDIKLNTMKKLLLPAALLCTVLSSQASIMIVVSDVDNTAFDAAIDGSGLVTPYSTGDAVPATLSQHYVGGNDNSVGKAEVIGGRVHAGAFTITLDLGGTYDIETVNLWNYAERWNGTYYNDRGVKDFDLEFSTDGGATFGNTVSLTAAMADDTGATTGDVLYDGETFDIIDQVGVTHVKFIAQDNYGGGYTGIAEVNFTGVQSVPEPSSAALLGLGGLALILRRRK